MKARADSRLQILRPLLWRSESCFRPIIRAHACTHLAAAIKKVATGRDLLHPVSHYSLIRGIPGVRIVQKQAIRSTIESKSIS